MTPDLFRIPASWRGTLAVVTRPRGGDWLEDEVSGWRRAGLDIVISLLEKDEAAQLELDHEADVAKSKGIEFVSFPIPDRGVPASTREALVLLTKTVAALEEGKSVAVHCRQGIGRSGMLAAGLLVTSGVAPDNAIGVVSAARGLTIPETPAQLDWIKHLPSEHLALAS
jgi:protein-tyrosine phosphatase